ncbi:MAG: hypothetical protein MZU97_00470 [Bacillus subtilis]|nr:hypothetical protein [Bacillus subtilis]
MTAPTDITVFDGLIYVADSGEIPSRRFYTFRIAVVRHRRRHFEQSDRHRHQSRRFACMSPIKRLVLSIQFALDGTLMKTFDRPEEPLYGAFQSVCSRQSCGGRG